MTFQAGCQSSPNLCTIPAKSGVPAPANLYKMFVDWYERAKWGSVRRMAEAPSNPFRVTKGPGGPKLTVSQRRILAALVGLCPDSGSEVDARTVAEAAGLRLGSVVVVLRSLEKQRLAVAHAGGQDAPEVWTPTLTGRSRVRHFPDVGDERPATAERRTT